MTENNPKASDKGNKEIDYNTIADIVFKRFVTKALLYFATGLGLLFAGILILQLFVDARVQSVLEEKLAGLQSRLDAADRQTRYRELKELDPKLLRLSVLEQETKSLIDLLPLENQVNIIDTAILADGQYSNLGPLGAGPIKDRNNEQVIHVNKIRNQTLRIDSLYRDIVDRGDVRWKVLQDLVVILIADDRKPSVQKNIYDRVQELLSSDLQPRRLKVPPSTLSRFIQIKETGIISQNDIDYFKTELKRDGNTMELLWLLTSISELEFRRLGCSLTALLVKAGLLTQVLAHTEDCKIFNSDSLYTKDTKF